jgi:hypothetical protein
MIKINKSAYCEFSIDGRFDGLMISKIKSKKWRIHLMKEPNLLEPVAIFKSEEQAIQFGDMLRRMLNIK